MSRHSPLFAALLLSAGMIAAGSVVVAAKLTALALPPFTAAALRYALAAAILLPWAWRRHGIPRLDRHDAVILLCQAALGSLGFSVLLLLGLRHGDAASASVAAGTLPLLVLAGSCLGQRRLPTPRLALASALAGLGVVAASHGGPVDPLIFAAIACEAAFVSLDRLMRQPPPPLTLSALLCLGGLLLTLPAALAEAWTPQSWPLSAWLALSWHGLVGTVLGFLCWYGGTARLGAGRAAPFTALFPITGIAAAPLVLDSPFALTTGLGGGLVVAGILLAAWPSKSTAVAPAAESV
ncbi:DMT family transporter [Magnetospirillum sulfuroxidans]|uniref:DMT family transporter n=1 Tax=Magnetospirillum sulfuroxidans TaxID=611300 RepID=A0ABS5IH39_9PROT|nr:DMT family transporter [Magnetospirillum sulfuroxidans]MBR9973008.1 DMT family transporter [Magnetospirillum sulfuroxidans]